jgi:hypothetical protein
MSTLFMLRRREDKGNPTSYYSPSPNLMTGCREEIAASRLIVKVWD